MDLNRQCTYAGHEIYLSSHICVAQNCKYMGKRCCVQCIIDGIHEHEKNDSTLYKPIQEAARQKREEASKLEQQYFKHRTQLLKKGLQQCIQIQKILQEYQQFIEQEIGNFKQEQEIFRNIIKDLDQEIFPKLGEERIDEILQFDKSQFQINVNQSLLPLENIDSQLNLLSTLLKKYYDSLRKENIFKDPKQIRYSIKQIDKTNSQFNVSQISNDEQYLAYGGDDCILKIYGIRNKVIKEIKFDSFIYACQFTFDSKQLFVGTYKGDVIGYDVLNKFKQIFKKQIHQDLVCNIRTISNKYLITCSNDRSIIKTDIRSKNQVIRFFHSVSIAAIDYDDKLDIIVSGCHDKSIIFLDCKIEQQSFKKEQSHQHPVRQIQLINSNQNLLSLDSNCNLYKWKIDLLNKSLLKLQEFCETQIYNFYQINNNQNLLLISRNQIRILNSLRQTIYTIDYQIGDFDQWMMDSIQLDNGRYIHIRSKRKIFIYQQNNLSQPRQKLMSYEI